jgi:transcriptional regulator with XRE-family HTH domain
LATFSDQIRQVIRRAPITRYELCKRIGFSESAMSRFMAGKQGVSLEVLDRIAGELGLRVVAGDRKQTRKVSQ